VAKRIVRILIILAAAVLIPALSAFWVIVAWVHDAPRDMPELAPYIESALSSKDGEIKTHIGEIWLIHDSWKHPLDIYLKDITITRAGSTFTSLSQIVLRLDWLSLPFGQVLPSAIIINKPTINLFQNKDHSISFGFGGIDLPAVEPSETEQKIEILPMVPVTTLLKLISDNASGLRKLSYLKITEAQATVGSLRHGAVFEVTGVSIIAKRSWRGDIRVIAGGNLHYQKNESAVGLEVLMGNYRPSLRVNLRFDKLVPSALAGVFSDEPSFKVLSMPLTGDISAIIGEEGSVESGLFNVDGGSGKIYSDLLTKPVDVDSLHAEGTLSDDGHEIDIDNLSVNMDKKVLSGKGKVSLKESDMAVNATLGITNVSASETAAFWPPSLAPLTREWVTENITEGTVPEATVKLNLGFGDLAKPALPREAVDASVTLNDATIRYLPDHPPTKKVQSTIHIDGQSLTANISSADYMQATKLTNGKLFIKDLIVDNPYITLGFDAATTARDTVRLLGLPRLNHAKHLNLDPETADGTGTAHAELGFYFFTPKDEKGKALEDDGITYNVVGELKDVSTPGFMRKFDIRNGNGKLTVDNAQITFRGTGNVNGATASQTNVVYKSKPENGYDTFIDVVGSAPVESLPRFGYPAFAFMKGSLGVKANVKLGDNKEDSSAAIDLGNAAINVFGWNKPAGEMASLDIKAEKREGMVAIPSFKLTGKGVDVAGAGALNKDFTEFQKLSMEKVTVGSTNLDHIDYEMANGKLALNVSGKSVDLSDWWDDEDSTREFSFEKFPAVQFKSNITRLTLSKQGNISNFKGEMTCSAARCENANVSGFTGDNKEFNFRILRNPKGKRLVSLRALDAGAFLKAFGAYPNIEGGELSVSGNYDDAGSVKGRLIIDNFTIKKAPVLAKILSLASLTGVLDLMQGGGISFSKLIVPYTLKHDVITIDKGKAYGGSIGITVEGTMTFPKQTLNMRGTVVPAYVLNSMVGKIPLVGAILTGGGGGGVFAFSYNVKGTERDPDVSVNPLSILTPGFLRGIFSGGGDEPEPAE